MIVFIVIAVDLIKIEELSTVNWNPGFDVAKLIPFTKYFPSLVISTENLYLLAPDVISKNKSTAKGVDESNETILIDEFAATLSVCSSLIVL